MILDKTSFDEFVVMLRNSSNHLVNNKYLMERLMNHYRELEGMSSNSRDATGDDTIIINEEIQADKIRATKTKIQDSGRDSQYLMMYKKCQHTMPVPRGMRERNIIHCHLCNQFDGTA